MRTSVLMVDRAGGPSQPSEAEPLLVETAPETVRLVLDDGEELICDRRELEAAIAPPAEVVAA